MRSPRDLQLASTIVPKTVPRMAHSAPPGRRAAFTLIEMLVVIAIISILMGLAVVGINVARDTGDEYAVESDIQFLRSGISKFNENLGDYPPTRLSDLDPKLKGNDVNEGIESLAACLIARRGGGPHADLVEDRWQNADSDQLSASQLKIVKKELDWIRGNAALLEYLDLWGQPYIYIHNRDYGQKFKYQLSDGTIFTVEARKNPQTGTYYGPTSYQLWSIGLDGKNDNGDGDDIASWR